MKKIKIALAGPRGKMGKEAIEMINENENFELIACIDRVSSKINVPVYTDIKECFRNENVDVFLDLTNPETGKKHLMIALEEKIPSVIGTTGFTDEEIKKIKEQSEKNKIGVIIAPNFSIGAILMMELSVKASKYFKDIEIIEMHHHQKKDAPSGTALKTKQMLKENGISSEIPIHSVRLPGLVAHQEVLFGSTGEGLSIRHDTYDRKSFMPGIKLSIEEVVMLKKFIYGLENIIK